MVDNQGPSNQFGAFSQGQKNGFPVPSPNYLGPQQGAPPFFQNPGNLVPPKFGFKPVPPSAVPPSNPMPTSWSRPSDPSNPGPQPGFPGMFNPANVQKKPEAPPTGQIDSGAASKQQPLFKPMPAPPNVGNSGLTPEDENQAGKQRSDQDNPSRPVPFSSSLNKGPKFGPSPPATLKKEGEANTPAMFPSAMYKAGAPAFEKAGIWGGPFGTKNTGAGQPKPGPVAVPDPPAERKMGPPFGAQGDLAYPKAGMYPKPGGLIPGNPPAKPPAPAEDFSGWPAPIIKPAVPISKPGPSGFQQKFMPNQQPDPGAAFTPPKQGLSSSFKSGPQGVKPLNPPVPESESDVTKELSNYELMGFEAKSAAGSSAMKIGPPVFGPKKELTYPKPIISIPKSAFDNVPAPPSDPSKKDSGDPPNVSKPIPPLVPAAKSDKEAAVLLPFDPKGKFGLPPSQQPPFPKPFPYAAPQKSGGDVEQKPSEPAKPPNFPQPASFGGLKMGSFNPSLVKPGTPFIPEPEKKAPELPQQPGSGELTPKVQPQQIGAGFEAGQVPFSSAFPPIKSGLTNPSAAGVEVVANPRPPAPGLFTPNVDGKPSLTVETHPPNAFKPGNFEPKFGPVPPAPGSQKPVFSPVTAPLGPSQSYKEERPLRQRVLPFRFAPHEKEEIMRILDKQAAPQKAPSEPQSMTPTSAPSPQSYSPALAQPKPSTQADLSKQASIEAQVGKPEERKDDSRPDSGVKTDPSKPNFGFSGPGIQPSPPNFQPFLPASTVPPASQQSKGQLNDQSKGAEESVISSTKNDSQPKAGADMRKMGMFPPGPGKFGPATSNPVGMTGAPPMAKPSVLPTSSKLGVGFSMGPSSTGFIPKPSVPAVNPMVQSAMNPTGPPAFNQSGPPGMNLGVPATSGLPKPSNAPMPFLPPGGSNPDLKPPMQGGVFPPPPVLPKSDPKPPDTLTYGTPVTMMKPGPPPTSATTGPMEGPGFPPAKPVEAGPLFPPKPMDKPSAFPPFGPGKPGIGSPEAFPQGVPVKETAVPGQKPPFFNQSNFPKPGPPLSKLGQSGVPQMFLGGAAYPPATFIGTLKCQFCHNARSNEHIYKEVRCQENCQVCKYCLVTAVTQTPLATCPKCKRELSEQEKVMIRAYSSSLPKS